MELPTQAVGARYCGKTLLCATAGRMLVATGGLPSKGATHQSYRSLIFAHPIGEPLAVRGEARTSTLVRDPARRAAKRWDDIYSAPVALGMEGDACSAG